MKIYHMPQNQIATEPSFPDSWLTRCWFVLAELLRSVKVRRRERAFRLCETLPLGEKRFLAVVQFEQKRFLIGATSNAITLLDRLDCAASPLGAREHGSQNHLGESMF